MKSIFGSVKNQQKLNLPFVLYKKPSSKIIIGVFPKEEHLYFSDDLSERGFVFAPFSGLPIVFPIEKSKIEYGNIDGQHTKIDSNELTVFDESQAAHFKEIVAKAIAIMKEGEMDKIVLSRKEIINLNRFDLEEVFTTIVFKYSSAFCYCWYHPEIGLWLGATPEKLFSADGATFKTMALAGTQSYSGTENVVWNSKEIQEQEFVTDFIVEKLKNQTDSLSISETYTTRAGDLLHLRTDIEGQLTKTANLKKVIDILHPTPAVCGLPNDLAKAFILANENYDREFYTGFLGEINMDVLKNKTATDLFVNLRCMKIRNTQAQLFVGCGVTKESDPDAEWKETCHKAKTMKQVL